MKNSFGLNAIKAPEEVKVEGIKETVEDKEKKETEALANVVAASEEKEFMKPTGSFGLTHKEEEKEKIQYFSP